jgi:hypothetical protein
MPTKFKQKFGLKLGKGIVFAAGLFLAILAFYGVSANKASADATCMSNTGSSQVCDFSQIQLKVDELTAPNQPNNFVRAAVNGSFSVEVKVTLVSPPSLTIGSTQINASGTPYTLYGFGAVLLPSTQTSANSGLCSLQNIYGSVSVPICTNPPLDVGQDKNTITATTFKQGDTVFDYTFNVSSANYSNLGFNLTNVNDGTSSTTGINLLYVDTGIGAAYNPTLCSLLGSVYNINCFYNTYLGSGNGLYVQLYQNQGKVNTANANGPPACTNGQTPVVGQPITCVPAYGSTTGAGNNPQNTPGGGLFGLVTSVIVYIASLINQLIYFLFYWLVAPLIQAVLSIHVYTDAFVNVIYPGWEIVRNVCNILFIVAIIAMGMATLLRVESYQWRHLLVQLVIAALLVNFSLIIGQAILALADTIQSQFLPNNVDVIRSLAQNLMVANNSTQLAQNSFGGQVSYIIQYLFFVAMAIGSFIVFAAIACFLVLRMVVLWVLLMLSPVAYVARILPATQSAAKKWWDEFIKYAFFTPIIAFFLNLTAVIAASFNSNPVLQSIQGANGAFAGSTLPGVSSFIFVVGSNILLLVFLILAIKVASYMGVAGGGMLSDIGEKGMKWPFSYTGNKIKEKGQAAGMFVDRNTRLKLADKLAPKDSDSGLKRFGKSLGFGVLAPGAQGAARKEAREHKYKEAKEMLAAHATDLVDPKARAAEKLKLQRENEKVKKAHDTYANASEAQVVAALNSAINKGDIVEFRALMKVATEENYMGAVARGVGGGDVNDVYRKMDAKMKSRDDKNKVDQTRKQVDKNEADKGRYQHMSNIPTTGPGTGARDQKLNSLSIEDMAKVDKDLYMTGGATLTGTATTVFKDIITAMGSNPDVARDMIKQLKKKEKVALRSLLGARGAPVTVPAGVNAADAAAAKGHFDAYVP